MKKINWNDLDDFSHTVPRTTDPYISVTNRQLITLSAGFIRHAKEQISTNTHVILSFSKSNNAIVFKFISDTSKRGAMKLSIRDRDGNITADVDQGSQASIAAKKFFGYYGVDPVSNAGRYMARLEIIPERGGFCGLYF